MTKIEKAQRAKWRVKIQKIVKSLGESTKYPKIRRAIANAGLEMATDNEITKARNVVFPNRRRGPAVIQFQPGDDQRPKCPYCGSLKSFIHTLSKKEGGLVSRHRKCVDCLGNFVRHGEPVKLQNAHYQKQFEITITEKLCPGCKKVLPRDQFQTKTQGIRLLKKLCADCCRANGHRDRLRFVLEKMGMSLDEYHKRADERKGRCEICNIKDTGIAAVMKARGRKNYNALIIDHCHKTGKFRGLICWNCNVALGHFRDNPEAMRAAIAYLEAHRPPDDSPPQSSHY
jgi:hypothetical protein